MQNLKIGVLLHTWADLLKDLTYKHVHKRTHIHSIDPSFCRMAFGYKTSHDTVKSRSHNTISGHVSETNR